MVNILDMMCQLWSHDRALQISVAADAAAYNNADMEQMYHPSAQVDLLIPPVLDDVRWLWQMAWAGLSSWTSFSGCRTSVHLKSLSAGPGYELEEVQRHSSLPARHIRTLGQPFLRRCVAR